MIYFSATDVHIVFCLRYDADAYALPMPLL